MKTKNAHTLNESIERYKKSMLEANGWKYAMGRWFWVWRKDVEDGSFTCLTLNEAVIIEQALQDSDVYLVRQSKPEVKG